MSLSYIHVLLPVQWSRAQGAHALTDVRRRRRVPLEARLSDRSTETSNVYNLSRRFGITCHRQLLTPDLLTTSTGHALLICVVTKSL